MGFYPLSGGKGNFVLNSVNIVPQSRLLELICMGQMDIMLLGMLIKPSLSFSNNSNNNLLKKKKKLMFLFLS